MLEHPVSENNGWQLSRGWLDALGAHTSSPPPPPTGPTRARLYAAHVLASVTRLGHVLLGVAGRAHAWRHR